MCTITQTYEYSNGASLPILVAKGWISLQLLLLTQMSGKALTVLKKRDECLP